jgi:hypothetical protein
MRCELSHQTLASMQIIHMQRALSVGRIHPMAWFINEACSALLPHSHSKQQLAKSRQHVPSLCSTMLQHACVSCLSSRSWCAQRHYGCISTAGTWLWQPLQPCCAMSPPFDAILQFRQLVLLMLLQHDFHACLMHPCIATVSCQTRIDAVTWQPVPDACVVWFMWFCAHKAFQEALHMLHRPLLAASAPCTAYSICIAALR